VRYQAALRPDISSYSQTAWEKYQKEQEKASHISN
jgi:hypothetical protein